MTLSDLQINSKNKLENQLELPDAVFINDLTLSGQAAVDLEKARLENNNKKAISVIASYFRQRKNIKWWPYLHGTAWLEEGTRGNVIENAELLLDDKLHNAWLPNQIIDCRSKNGFDWDKALESKTDTTRNGFVVIASTAFTLNGKTAYIDKAVELMKGFVKAYPFILDPGFHEDQDRYFGGDANNGLAVKSRIFRWVDFMYSGAIQTPGLVSDEDLFWMLKQIWFYSVQLHRLTGNEMRRDNHHLMDHGHAHVVLGIMFPEFSFTKDMFKYGKKVIQYHVDYNLFDDGCYAEHCPKYQYHISWCILGPLTIAKANDVNLFSDKHLKKLRKWLDFFVSACMPNGYISEIGDEEGDRLTYFYENLCPPIQTPALVKAAAAMGYQVASFKPLSAAAISAKVKKLKSGQAGLIGLSPHFSNAKVPKLNKNDLKKIRPAVQYPLGGFSFFRGNSQVDSDFMGVSHYTKSLPHAHAHWDMMSFILHSKGETLIGDPATALYSLVNKHKDYKDAEYRGYFYAPDSHNCMIINDDTIKPLKTLGHQCNWGNFPPKHELGIFASGEHIEIAEMTNFIPVPFTHRRFVIHLRGIGFAFVDILEENPISVRPHQYAQRYHLEWDVEASPLNDTMSGGGLCLKKDKSKAFIIPGEDVDYKWNNWHDSYLKNLPGVESRDLKTGPLVLELMRRNSGRVVFSTFVITEPSAKLRKIPKAQYLGNKKSDYLYAQQDRLSANMLDLGNYGKIYLASCPYETQLENFELSTDADIAVVLEDKDGKIISALMAGGTHLVSKDRVLYQGRRKKLHVINNQKRLELVLRKKCDNLKISWPSKNNYGSLENTIRQIRDSHDLELNAEIWQEQNKNASFNDWRQAARQCLLSSFNYDPQKLDLQSEVLEKIEHDDYILEKVAFNTTPWFRLNAYFMYPKGISGPVPGLIVKHAWGGPMIFGKERIVNTGRDHSVLKEHRKTFYDSRYLSEELVRAGYAVIVIDSYHFGERSPRGINTIPEEYDPFELPISNVVGISNLCSETLFLGLKELNWAGTTWTGINFQDDSRCVDYLLSRAEVDSEKIGCTGLSGGAWRTNILSALDPRIKAAVSVGWMTSGDHQQLYNVNGAINTFCLLPGVWNKMDIPDLTVMGAPCASMIVLGTKDHLFPPEGKDEAVRQIKAGYEWAGCPDKFRYFAPEAEHCYNYEIQQEAISWFDKHLKGLK